QGPGSYPHDRQKIRLSIRSVKKVPARIGSMFIEAIARTTAGRVEVTLAGIRRPLGVKAGRARTVPKYVMRCRLDELHFPPDGAVPLRLNFLGASEVFVLRLDPLGGLRLEGLALRHGRIVGGEVDKFAVASVTEGRRRYQCCNLSASADERGKHLWTRRLTIEGRPVAITVVGPALLVITSAGHSQYLRKADGEPILYHKGELPGRSPLAEVLSSAAQAHAAGGRRAGLGDHIWAVATLGDTRGAGFLIECIDKASGLRNKALAVAALELLAGNKKMWPKGGPKDVRALHRRVKTPQARAGEVRRWEKRFGSAATKVLGSPAAAHGD
ncbi:hypothetical protein LCGC14_2564540, partial [marine sediment metagenome]